MGCRGGSGARSFARPLLPRRPPPDLPRSSTWPRVARCPFARFTAQRWPAAAPGNDRLLRVPVDRPASTAAPRTVTRVVPVRARSSGQRAREIGFRAWPPRACCCRGSRLLGSPTSGSQPICGHWWFVVGKAGTWAGLLARLLWLVSRSLGAVERENARNGVSVEAGLAQFAAIIGSVTDNLRPGAMASCRPLHVRARPCSCSSAL
jgi:hypothetical protein